MRGEEGGREVHDMVRIEIRQSTRTVIPAQAGTQTSSRVCGDESFFRAAARIALDSLFRGNDAVIYECFNGP
jgi:hypothetical protein